MNLAHILVVEDDDTLAQLLRLNLEIEGYKVDTAGSAEEALGLPLKQYSLILLDVMMGEMSGFAFARLLKAAPSTAAIPIVFCTARDNEDDMVKGLGIGADDYIYKPYTVRNVIARVEAVLRRSSRNEPAAESNIVSYKGIELDRRMKRCCVDGKPVSLVKKEYEILELMLINRGRIFSREEMLQKVWKGEVVVLERTIDVNITRLRHKLAPYGACIVTRPGYGYGLE
ncbi:MAG: response regulator transcription factor [Muribaculaceae bacterium]|nr:response regulator transcription factor [Muribaculaceae bacterium]